MSDSLPSRPRLGWIRSVARTAVGLGLLGLAAVAFRMDRSYRSLEVALSVPLASIITAGKVLHMSGTDRMVVGGRTDFLTLILTPECTSAVVIIPLLVVLGVLTVVGRRISVQRILVAGAVTILLVVTVNTIRFASIAGAAAAWHRPGYEVSHTLVGSLISIFGFCLALYVGFRVLTGDDRARETGS